MNHTAAHLALRALLKTLSVCTTGSTTLAATSSGYTRSAGSFVDDGFAAGQEATPAGFVATTPRVVTSVTALTLSVDTTSGNVSSESASSGRTLSVLIPTSQAWENIRHTPQTGVPYVEEEYVPGPTRKISLGAFGEVEALPLYVVKVYVPANKGRAAASLYADALLDLFAPETAITVSGATLRVRGDVAPFAGQLLQTATGFAVVSVTVPLRLRTANTV